jgi:hypothetical protein
MFWQFETIIHLGLIILDDDSDTKFHRIIAAKEDLLKSSFIKIPTLFLRKKETDIFEELIHSGKKFLVRMSGEKLSFFCGGDPIKKQKTNI